MFWSGQHMKLIFSGYRLCGSHKINYLQDQLPSAVATRQSPGLESYSGRQELQNHAYTLAGLNKVQTLRSRLKERLGDLSIFHLKVMCYESCDHRRLKAPCTLHYCLHRSCTVAPRVLIDLPYAMCHHRVPPLRTGRIAMYDYISLMEIQYGLIAKWAPFQMPTTWISHT